MSTRAEYGVWGVEVYLKPFGVRLVWAVVRVAYASYAFCKQVLECNFRVHMYTSVHRPFV